MIAESSRIVTTELPKLCVAGRGNRLLDLYCRKTFVIEY